MADLVGIHRHQGMSGYGPKATKMMRRSVWSLSANRDHQHKQKDRLAAASPKSDQVFGSEAAAISVLHPSASYATTPEAACCDDQARQSCTDYRTGNGDDGCI